MFTEIHMRYPTRFSRSSFKQPKIITKVTSFVISSGESKIWNNYLHELDKTILSLLWFYNKLKTKLLGSEGKLTYFWQSTEISIYVLFRPDIIFMWFLRIEILKYGCTFQRVFVWFVYREGKFVSKNDWRLPQGSIFFTKVFVIFLFIIILFDAIFWI